MKNIGPCTTKPGHPHPLDGSMCDVHTNIIATHRIQGETDSTGAELLDMCDECYALFLESEPDDNIGSCDWCKADNVKLLQQRDWEEGMSGPLYDVCLPCVRKANKAAEDELDTQVD